jgi:predicted RND superfamily exporter protein
VFVLFALVALLAAAGLPRLERDTDVLAYLPREHPVRRDLERLQGVGIGAVSAEVVLESAEGTSPFLQPEGFESLSRLSAELRQEPEVLSVLSAGELLDSAGSFEALAVRPELIPLLRILRTDDGRQARLAVSVPMEGVEELEPVLTRLREISQSAFPDARVHLTGRFPLVLAAQGRVLTTMITSLSLTFAIVAGIFLVLFRNLRLTAVALAPNLWPVLCVLGAMGWLGVPLDGTTMMIASVVLGLAVDDTLHTLGRYRHEGTGDPVSTLEHTAPAHLLTTAVLSAGFGVCAFSGFVPISRFGALTVLALGLALAADLWLVPALLGRPRQPSSGDPATPQHQESAAQQ